MLTAGGDDFLSLLADWSSKLGSLNSGANIGNFLPTYLPPNLGNIVTHLSSHAHWRQCDQMADF